MNNNFRTLAIVPAYNEEKTIEKVISEIKDVGLIPVVVDDGSTDKTYEIAKKMNITVIKHNENKGKGEAIKTGFNYILKSLPEVKSVVILDGDLQYSPKDSTRILEVLEKNEADFVMGYRDWSTVPPRHNFGNLIWRGTFNLFFGTKLKDTNCGYMGLSRTAMKKIRRVHGGYIIENMMLLEALKNKLRIKQVPVSVTYRKKRGIPSCLRMGLGVLVFIIIEGIKYQLSKI